MSSSLAPSSAGTYHGGARIDRYEVLELLGAGGFGAVYRARHVHTHQIVAIKVLRSIARTNAVAWEGLLKEARTTAALGHPNILRVLDCGVAEGGTPFLVMELAEGEDLGKLLVREARTLAPQRAVDLMVQVLSALSAAHERGIVHRDVKPANIIVTQVRDASGAMREHARLLDFGISKMRDSEWARTQPGTSMGTPGYMAPEQFESAAEADARADIYAVAATLYQLLSGRLPIEATTQEGLLSRLLTETPTPLARVAPHVPTALATVIDAGLSREPKFRWSSASEFAAALQSAMQSSQSAMAAFAQAPTMALDPRALASAPTAAVSASQLGQAPTVSIAPGAPVSTRFPSPAHAQPPTAWQSMASASTSATPSIGLGNAAQGGVVFAAPPPVQPAARAPSRTRSVLAAGIVTVLVAGVVVGAFALGRSQDDAPEPVQASQPMPTNTVQPIPSLPTWPATPVPPVPTIPPVAESPVPPAHGSQLAAPEIPSGLDLPSSFTQPRPDEAVPNGTTHGPEAETVNAVLATAPGVVIEQVNMLMNVSLDVARAIARSAVAGIQRCNLHVGNERTYVQVMFTVSGPHVQPTGSSMVVPSAFECVGPAIQAALPAVPPTTGIFTLRVHPPHR